MRYTFFHNFVVVLDDSAVAAHNMLYVCIENVYANAWPVLSYVIFWFGFQSSNGLTDFLFNEFNFKLNTDLNNFALKSCHSYTVTWWFQFGRIGNHLNAPCTYSEWLICCKIEIIAVPKKGKKMTSQNEQ